MLGFLGSMLAGPLVRAGSWLLGKLTGSSKSTPAASPSPPNTGQNGGGGFVNGALGLLQRGVQTLGPIATKAYNEDSFNTHMRRFGDTINERTKNMKLPLVGNGVNLGDAFYKGMTNIYSYMKNGGQNPDQPTDQNGRPMEGVERTQQQQQDGQQQQQQQQQQFYQ